VAGMWALCRLMLSEGRAGPHSRPLLALEAAPAWAISIEAAWLAAAGRPCAAGWAMSPCGSPGWRKATGLVALDGQLRLGTTILTPRWRCVPGLGGRLPGLYRAGVDGLIRLPVFAGHGLAAAGDAVGLTAGKPRLESAESCAAKLILPQQRQRCVLRLRGSLIGSIRELLTLARMVVHQPSDPAGCSRTNGRVLPARRAARWR